MVDVREPVHGVQGVHLGHDPAVGVEAHKHAVAQPIADGPARHVFVQDGSVFHESVVDGGLATVQDPSLVLGQGGVLGVAVRPKMTGVVAGTPAHPQRAVQRVTPRAAGTIVGKGVVRDPREGSAVGLARKRKPTLAQPVECIEGTWVVVFERKHDFVGSTRFRRP